MKICSTPGCGKKSRSQGLCTNHYQRFFRSGDFLKVNSTNEGSCSVPGCDKKAMTKGFCSKHYHAFKAHGDPEGGRTRPVPRTDGLKVCPKCNLPKEKTEFNKSSERKLQGYCRACMCIWNQENKGKKRAYARVAYRKDPAKANAVTRKCRLMSQYGLTIEAYELMLTNQNGVCAICGLAETRSKKMAVDHNHATGKVRGLLCSFCNPGIGLFKDSVATLSAAIEYLKRSDGGTQ